MLVKHDKACERYARDGEKCPCIVNDERKVVLTGDEADALYAELVTMLFNHEHKFQLQPAADALNKLGIIVKI
jgi:hypothetical protein